jgi:hypothetical protein
MTVETDRVYVDPFVTESNLYIYPCEAYSVLVTTGKDPHRNCGISKNMIARKPATPNGFAINLIYEFNPLDAQPLP